MPSGKYGKVMIASDTLAEVMNWSFDRSVSDNPHGTSSTGGFKDRTAGTRDGTGSMSGLQDFTDPIEGHFNEGDSVTLLLYVSATLFYSVPALISKLTTSVDVDDGAPVPWSADFGIKGAWTEPSWS